MTIPNFIHGDMFFFFFSVSHVTAEGNQWEKYRQEESIL